MLTHFFSVDIEDWFHILDYDVPPELQDWETLESRVERNTFRVLDLLDEADVKCTCFVLGWIAERYPELVKAIAERGHELAAHGHRHLLIYESSRDAFERDLVESLDAIEAAAGVRPVGFRAPGFSILNDTLWALDVMAERGLLYDASLFTAARGHGGIQMDLPGPSLLQTSEGHILAEFPIAPHLLWGKIPISFAGGGYLRLFPAWWIEHCIRVREALGEPTTIYCHPRDFDPDQPRIRALSGWRMFKSYVGLATTQRKVRRLLERFTFGRIIDRLPALEGQSPIVLK